jgi:hypothetical protein
MSPLSISFAPFAFDAAEFLTQETGIEFRHIDFRSPRWFCVTARREADDSLMGVAVFEFKTWFDAHFSTAIADPRCMSRRLLRTMFSTVFRQAVRITALVDPHAEKTVALTRQMGFVYEGFLRLGVEGNRDALIFGMLREDCRYLPGYSPATASIKPLSLGGHHHGLQS